MKKNKTKIEKKVMEKIQKDDVKMHSKWYYLLGSTLLGVGSIATLISVSMFAHAVLYRARALAPFSYLRYGVSGLKPFVFAFPWVAFLLALTFTLFGIHLLKKYDFSYKRNYIYLISGVLISILMGAFLLSKIHFERRANKVKGIRNFYRTKEEWIVPTPKLRVDPKVKGLQNNRGGRFQAK